MVAHLPQTSVAAADRNLEQELYYLIARFLSTGPCRNASQALRQDLDQHSYLLPHRYDWQGKSHVKTVDELIQQYPHVTPHHLHTLLSRLTVHANTRLPPPAPGLGTLLGHADASLLRTTSVHEQKPFVGHAPRTQLQKLIVGRRLSNPHPCLSFQARELGARSFARESPPRFIAKSYQELVTVFGHRFAVYCVKFDRTGLRLITGSDDYLVKIWCARTGTLIYTLRGHQNVITDMAINEENTLLATASTDGIVRVWNMQNYAPVAVLLGNLQSSRKGFTTVRFSPSPRAESRYLLTTSEDGLTRLWKWDRQTLKFEPNPIIFDCRFKARDQTRCSSFNHSGTRFAVSGNDGFIRVFSTVEGVKFDTSRLMLDAAARLSKDNAGSGSEADVRKGGRRTHRRLLELALTSDSARGDVHGPMLIAQLEGHMGCVTDVAYSHDGKKILSGCMDGTARIWFFEKSTKSWTSICLDIKNQENQSDAVIATARNMAPQTGPAPPSNTEHISTPMALTMSQSSSNDGFGSGSGVAIPISAPVEPASLTGFLPMPSTSVSAPTPVSMLHNAGTVPVQGLANLTLNSSPADLANGVHTGDAQAFQNVIITSDAAGPQITLNAPVDNTSDAVDTDDNAARLKERPKVSMIAWSLDDSRAIVATTYGELKVFDAVTGELCSVLRGHRDETYAVDIHPVDKRVVLSAGYDGRIILWDLDTARQIKCDNFPDRMWLDCKFCEDGSMYAVTDSEGRCSLFGVGQSLGPYTEAQTWAQTGQQFWTDYLPVRYDDNWNFVDEQSQIAPHLTERGDILNWGGMPYAQQKHKNFGLDFSTSLPPGVLEREEEQRLAWYEQEKEEIKAEAIAAIPKIDRAKIYKMRKDFVREDDDEEDPMTIDVPIVPLPAEDDDEDYQEGVQHSESEEDDAGESLSDDLGGHGRDYDDAGFVEDDDGDGSYLERRSRTGSPRKSRLKRRAPRSGSKLAGRNGDRRGKRNKRKRNVDEDDEEFSQTSTRPGGRLRRRHAVQYKESDISMDEDEESESEIEDIDIDGDDIADEIVHVEDDDAGEGSSRTPKKRRRLVSKISTNGSASRGRRKKGRVNGAADDDMIDEIPPNLKLQHFMPSDWISSTTPRVSPYHPQLGDHVAYFGQGHQQYWDRSSMTSKFNSRNGPFDTADAVMFGEVIKTEWHIGPPTWCRLKMRLLDLRNAEQVLWTEEAPEWHVIKGELHIDFCDEEGMPDFIILFSRFIDGMRQRFDVGADVNALYGDELWGGKIVERIDTGKLWKKAQIQSPWQCFRVAWTNGSEPENLSPWELLRPEFQINDIYTETEQVPEHEKQRIKDVLCWLKNEDEFEVFVETVDFKAVPDYLTVVAYPSCVDFVLDRLVKNWYRRTKAVVCDFEQITKNAHKYNQSGSDIFQAATKLQRLFKTRVEDWTKPLEVLRQVKPKEEDQSQDEYQATENGDEEDEEIQPDHGYENNALQELNGHEGSSQDGEYEEEEQAQRVQRIRLKVAYHKVPSATSSPAASIPLRTRLTRGRSVPSESDGGANEEDIGSSTSRVSRRSRRVNRVAESDDDEYDDG
ncbi:hypothetical protein BC938DRAFT_480071 [Jimgerdemannia flammicorona]|uniref:Bromo domain-containing protein n=1 Tax=Jimgerdemannia flammicorona TaxID=994334 RepID=A0A433QJH1_9FUNG|nr:hypothetical protein BC938DRAFT_480071 [Jimgerdemannia flammicorona]